VSNLYGFTILQGESWFLDPSNSFFLETNKEVFHGVIVSAVYANDQERLFFRYLEAGELTQRLENRVCSTKWVIYHHGMSGLGYDVDPDPMCFQSRV